MCIIPDKQAKTQGFQPKYILLKIKNYQQIKDISLCFLFEHIMKFQKLYLEHSVLSAKKQIRSKYLQFEYNWVL